MCRCRHTELHDLFQHYLFAHCNTPRQNLTFDPHFYTIIQTNSNVTMPETRRIAQIVRVKPEKLREYKECHENVWPAVLEQIKDCNISDYSIFLDERSMTLFATMKWTGTDYDADMEKMRANPEVQRWWQMTDSMQESLVEGSTGSTDSKGWWQNLEEVFRCE